jgi:arginine/ornithine N-succinyltransferase beta subunit
MSKYDPVKLADMGYGDITYNGPTVELTDDEVRDLAESVGGTVEEIETARI